MTHESVVTNVFQDYRLLLIAVWNHFFMPLPDDVTDGWEVVSGFHEASAVLFRELLLRKLALVTDLEPPFVFAVRPTAEGGLGTKWATIQIGEVTREGSPVTFGADIRSVELTHVDLVFLDFFDFMEDGIRTFDYYRTMITASLRYPELVGRQALISVIGSEVVLKGDHDSKLDRES